MTASDVDLNKMLEYIQQQMLELVNDEDYVEIYEGYSIKMSLEQQFMKIKDKDPHAIYIVVKFNSASVTFGQIVLPFTITVLSEEDKSSIAQKLLFDFSERYNLARLEDDTIQQVYMSPEINGNFNAVYAGFRSVVRSSGVFVISTNANFFKILYNYDDNGVIRSEEVPQITASLTLTQNPDTQVFYNSNDFARSIVTFGSFSLTFTTFILNDSAVINKVIDIVCESKNGDDLLASVNNTFNFDISFRDGRKRSKPYKLVNFSTTQEIGQIPVMSLVFSE